MPVPVTADASRRRRVAVLLAGLTGVAVGVGCMIEAQLGVAPYDVLGTGVRDLFDIPMAVAAIIVPIVFLGLGVALGGRVGLGTVLAVVLVGPVLGLVLRLVPDIDPMAPRLALFAAGFVAVTIGVALVIVPDIGPAPPELLMLALHDRGYPLARVRTVIEVASVAVGWAMGGQVGAGTVVFALLIGPALRRTLEAMGFDTQAAIIAADTARTRG